MPKNIGYHTRLYADNSVKVSGGCFGGSLDQETVERLTRLFEVTVKPSGTAVFVDREGREVRLYLSVDADKTEKGRAALAKFKAEQAQKEKIAQAQAEQEQAEIESAMEGLSAAEILRRLRGEL